ncbi:Pogo transposable element-like 92 [Homarus americanus]|uniref:Pogo transposable element-like 92 n=1 Tax=Homarus americanus TaxID=6706 RepID=A0A8J5K4T1_HOMAM|nr:Pogo transposable element-like 92 [Homarus americanus]
MSKLMGRGSTSTTHNGPGLVLECESEGLSDVQITKIQKLEDDLLKLQFMLKNGAVQNENVSVQTLVNGTAGSNITSVAATVAQPLSNGTNVFLLLQNGQMIATTGTLPTNGQTVTTTPATSFVATTSTVSVSPSNTTTDPVSKSKTSTIRTTTTSSATSIATRSTRGSIVNKNNTTNSTNSPDIQVLREMRIPTHTQSSELPTQTTSTISCGNSPPNTSGGTSPPINKFLPLLNVIARPKNTLPPAVAISLRKELDAEIKSVLFKSPQEFVEWLLTVRLIRNTQYCSIHKIPFSETPVKLTLGKFLDPKVLSSSGGYVWISECCGKKYVSVYSGSIFGSTPIDKVPPTSVLKLVYHWACQTSISNVELWVKVEKTFINKMYQYMRCISSVMLQDKVYDFGFDGTTVELGIVSLGTSTADGAKKALKVEILGLYDRIMKSYRLFAFEPEPGSSSRRFVRILKPLERVVHINAIILCDQSVDRNCLYNMNYGKGALSHLNLEQVQLVLDELCWRERYGYCAAQAYIKMVDHITYLTAQEVENPGVLHLLDFVSQKPQHNWRYKSQHIGHIEPPSPSVTSFQTGRGASDTQTPIKHTKKRTLSQKQGSSLGAPGSKVPVASVSPKFDSVALEPCYYGQKHGVANMGREENIHMFNCHICNEVFNSNLDFYSHLKFHLCHNAGVNDKFCCNYCIEHFETEEKRDNHHKFRHMQVDASCFWCRICSNPFKEDYQLIDHMTVEHYPSELPYRCELCHFATSIYFSVIDHFNKEHKETPHVQCHFCLRVKSITTTSANTFSQRMFQHLLNHSFQVWKCKSCVLSFYSKYILDEHKRRDHISCVNVKGLQRYKVPAGQNRIMFRPWVKSAPMPNQDVTYYANSQQNSIVAISSTLEVINNLKVDTNDEDKSYYCIECDESLTLENHFRVFQKCAKCSYATCCSSMISRHDQVFHPSGINKRHYNIGPPIILPQPLFCICGFSTRSGNHLARHLALCEGGRKSAYPSVSDVMVYHGDPVTGGALSLANLGLSNIAVSGILSPGTLLPSVTPDVQETREPSLDITHFMSVSMEVDD